MSGALMQRAAAVSLHALSRGFGTKIQQKAPYGDERHQKAMWGLKVR